MIDKHNCCGCETCLQVCPQQCINLYNDEEGFWYPKVDEDVCINCHICENVCPCLNIAEKHEPVSTVAAVNPDEGVRKKSSSGGIFYMLAESVINDGGVVFGARFTDDWNVELSCTETLSGLSHFRGSKYVQAAVGTSYIQCKKFLGQGRKVLFSGTPCHISGLKLFLKKEYDNLLTVECVCHGVPSASMWKKYLSEQTKLDKHTIADIESINFRDKKSGWRNYSFSIKYKDGKEAHYLHDENPWERAFIKNIDLRTSCHNCPAKCLQSRADITLGDLWGAEHLLPEENSNTGITLFVSHNPKGISMLKNLNVLRELSFNDVENYNGSLTRCPIEHPRRQEFFEKVQKKGFIKTVMTITKDPFILRMKLSISKMMDRL